MASSKAAGTTTIPTEARNHSRPASVPSPSACPIESTQTSAVQRCSRRQRATPMRARA